MTSVVVALRYAGRDARPCELLASFVRSAIERAAVLGGRLVGTAADGASFTFDDALEEAIDFSVALVGDLAREPYKVGIGAGELATVREEGLVSRLSVGGAMGRAAAMARVARAGEVVVDLALPAAAAGTLLSMGRRVATDSGRRFRGMVLDLHEPWRRGGGDAAAALRTPRIVGRESALEAVSRVGPGGLSVVRATPGIGGSRFLEELAARTSRTLLIGPVGCGAEPLGALREALARDLDSMTATDGPTTQRETDKLRVLQSGGGISVHEAADLIFHFFGGPGGPADAAGEAERPLILVDDAAQVDGATLEAVGFAASAAGAPFGVVVRLDSGEMVPAPLASLVVEGEVTLRPLLPHEATAALEDACGGASSVGIDVVRRWARRGGGVPLSIVESLRHGLSVGELAVRDGKIVPRGKAAGRGRALSPNAWITRRLTALATDRPDDVRLASLVAVAGPGVSLTRLSLAAEELSLVVEDGLQGALARLERDSVLVSRTGTHAPSSRTLRDALLYRCDDIERRRLHGALAAAFTRDAHGLDLAEGAHHAAMAGDHLGAESLAARASERAQRAGLETWAAQLAAFARAEGQARAAGGPLLTAPSPPPTPSKLSPPTPPPAGRPEDEILELDPDLLESLEEALSDEPEAVAQPTHEPAITAGPGTAGAGPREEGPLTLRTPEPPDVGHSSGAPEPARSPRLTLGITNLTTGQIAALPATFLLQRLPSLESLQITDEVALDGEAVHIDSSLPFEPPPVFSLAREPQPPEPDEDDPHHIADRARRALLASDFGALEQALTHLEAAGGSLPAIARVRAVSALARGNLVEGIRQVRRSLGAARSEPERARGALASAVLHGVSGRRDDALLSALEALSAERASGDKHGAGDRAVRRLIDRILQPPQ